MFPCWERLVPPLGTNSSFGGNKLFPSLEQEGTDIGTGESLIVFLYLKNRKQNANKDDVSHCLADGHRSEGNRKVASHQS